MKRSFGAIFMVLGLALLTGALLLYLSNHKEEEQAELSVQEFMPQVVERIELNVQALKQEVDMQESPSESVESESQMPYEPDYYSTEMTVETIDGYDFIGYLTIDELDLQLPILAQSDDAKLKKSPCRFSGATKTNDLVIGAHNYSRHFGRITELKSGDIIYLTDMDGRIWKYTYVTQEILGPNDVDILTNAEYALTLFTCTYGGRSRITLRFDLVET